MENEIFIYVCYSREMVKSNGSIEYKGGRVITKIMNIHIPYTETCDYNTTCIHISNMTSLIYLPKHGLINICRNMDST